MNRTHLFRYHRFHIDKSQPLGHGAYGAVCKAKYVQLPCAAKVLHPTILDPGAGKIMDRFRQECSFLESIRHPNIVQYLGMSTDPESRLPVLLMELLDENLTKMLERSPQSLAYHIQVDICHDIALAVAYLHSNDIIHRDLSSNNVLMIAGRRAKVTDFGMSKISGVAPTMTPLTMCPGTLAYMSPEALREPPQYTKRLDCFSEGVLMIQVCTRLWPEPGPRTEMIEDSRYPAGVVEVPVPERERRKNHIDLVDPAHPLLAIAMDCLKYQENERPSSEELCQRLAGLKVVSDYRDSVQEQRDEVQAKDDQIVTLSQQLQDKERPIQDKDNQLQRVIQDKDGLLQDKDRQLDEQRRLTAERERQLRQLSQEQEQITADLRLTNHSLQRQVEQLQQQLSQQSLKQLDLEHKQQQSKIATVHRLNWRDAGRAPFRMSRGAAVVDGHLAYFMNNDGRTCSYDSTIVKWSMYPKYPFQCGSLAIVNGQLTAIGGRKNVYDKRTYTNQLLSLHVQGGWMSLFPPMPTKRRHASAIATSEHLIVAGGATGLECVDNIAIVEVMDTKALVWSTVASLPHPYNVASSVICGDKLYLLGGWDDKGKTKSVLTCSVTELLQRSSESSSVWHKVADSPDYHSTCAAVGGELLTIGGCDGMNKATTAVHKYNPQDNSWNLISNMPTARYRPLVALLPTNELMVVDGKEKYSDVDNIEIATF